MQGHAYGPLRSLPYTGKEPGGWKWGYSAPKGYRLNHPYHGIRGGLLLFANSQWGKGFYAKRSGINALKISLGFFLCYWPLDSYMCNIRKLKAKKANS